MRTQKQSAFTLVELAIVLVIIGLIVGGVLVGQDLINAAKVRATVSDIEKYNAAATTFREKYSGLPGDLLNTRAVQFGFNTAADDAARDGTFGHGDGNGSLNGCEDKNTAPSPLQVTIGCEVVLFWADLSQAKLISFSSRLTSITGTKQGNASTRMLADGILPKTRLRDSALIVAFSNSTPAWGLVGVNQFAIAAVVTEDLSITEEDTAKALTPLEAQQIDAKLDDGLPLTGVIISNTTIGLPDDGTVDGCVENSTGQYNTVTDALASTTACIVSIRASF